MYKAFTILLLLVAMAAVFSVILPHSVLSKTDGALTLKLIAGQTAKPPMQKGVTTIDMEHEAELKAKRESASGTKVSPNNSLDRIEAQFCRDFNKANMVPAERTKRFAWCFEKKGLRVRGWYGRVEAVTKNGDEYEVHVRLSPDLLWDQANITWTPDNCRETWKYREGKLSFVKLESPNEAMEALFGD